MLRVSDCIADSIPLTPYKTPPKGQRIGNQVDAAIRLILPCARVSIVGRKPLAPFVIGH